MLPYVVRIHLNPWEHTVPEDKLLRIMDNVAAKRAEHIERQFVTGHYEEARLGLAILDPTAPLWRPSSETLLATVAIGSDGERFIPNAVAKAVEHRDKGVLAGYGAYVDLTQTQDGDFTYGYSTQVDGTIAGASGQTELQDACEAGHALVAFNYHVRSARKKWHDANPGKRWFSNEDLPRDLYTEMAERTEVIYGVEHR